MAFYIVGLIHLEINKSNSKNYQLANKFCIFEPTVSKWRNRKSFEDKSSRPYTVYYVLNRKLLLKIVCLWCFADDLDKLVERLLSFYGLETE